MPWAVCPQACHALGSGPAGWGLWVHARYAPAVQYATEANLLAQFEVWLTLPSKVLALPCPAPPNCRSAHAVFLTGVNQPPRLKVQGANTHGLLP